MAHPLWAADVARGVGQVTDIVLSVLLDTVTLWLFVGLPAGCAIVLVTDHVCSRMGEEE